MIFYCFFYVGFLFMEIKKNNLPLEGWDIVQTIFSKFILEINLVQCLGHKYA